MLVIGWPHEPLAQRLVQAGNAGASTLAGINALCFLHPGKFWLDEPPADMGSGILIKSIELPWELAHSEVRFAFNLEASLAPTWQVEPECVNPPETLVF